MRSRSIVSVLSMGFVLSLATVVGCAAPEQDTVSNDDNFTSAAAPSALKAEIKEVPVNITKDKCKIESSILEVKLPNAAHAESINKELNTNFDEWLTECNELAFSLEGGSTATFNERGFLSVTISESTYTEMAAHPNNGFVTKNFDLATGKLVQLADILDADGIKILVEGCKRGVAETLDDPELDFGDFCETAAIVDEYGSVPIYAVEAEGIRLHPMSMPHAIFVAAAEGGLATWAELKGHIKNDTVKAIATPASAR